MNKSKIKCPYCKNQLYTSEQMMGQSVSELKNGQSSVYKCNKCKKSFVVKRKSDTDYRVKELITDLPGQYFFWEDLKLGGVAIYKH